jgi:hypothetical protein
VLRTIRALACLMSYYMRWSFGAKILALPLLLSENLHLTLRCACWSRNLTRWTKTAADRWSFRTIVQNELRGFESDRPTG